MTDPEFDDFLAMRVASLEAKQEDLAERFGLGSHARWDYDQASGLLRFSDAGGQAVVDADTTPIGSWSAKSQSWQWAWANPSILDPSRSRAVVLRGLYEATDGLDCFHIESFDCDEELAWNLVALSVDHLGALGYYRGPAGTLSVFLAIDAVRAIGNDK